VLVMPEGRWWLRVAAVSSRLGFVRGAVLLGTALVVVSEGLGAVDAFARGPVVAAWLAVAAAVAAVTAWAVRRDAGAPPSSTRAGDAGWTGSRSRASRSCWRPA
jgi:hypothetical protein